MSKKTQNKQQRQQKRRQNKTQKKQQKCQQKQQKQRKTQKRQQKRQQQRRSRKQQMKKKQRGGAASMPKPPSPPDFKIGTYNFSSKGKSYNYGNINKLLTVREYVKLSYDDKKKLHDLINKQKEIYFASNHDLSIPINNLKEKGIIIEDENPRDQMKAYIEKYSDGDIIVAIENQNSNDDKLEKLVYPYNPTIDHTTKSNSQKYIKLLNDKNMISENKLKFLALLYNTKLFLHYFHSYDDIIGSINEGIINLKNPPFLLNDDEIHYLKERLMGNFLDIREEYIDNFTRKLREPKVPPPVSPEKRKRIAKSSRRHNGYPSDEFFEERNATLTQQQTQPHVANNATQATGSTTSPEQPQTPRTFKVETTTTIDNDNDNKKIPCYSIIEV